MCLGEIGEGLKIANVENCQENCGKGEVKVNGIGRWK